MAARTILLADEDVDTRIILRTVLERQRFAVLEASNGDEAIAIAERQVVDLVILNHPMVGRDGRSLVQRLRALDNLRAVPVLNLTSRVVPQFLEEASVQGVTMTLAKPIDVENVLHIVSQLTFRPLVYAG